MTVADRDALVERLDALKPGDSQIATIEGHAMMFVATNERAMHTDRRRCVVCCISCRALVDEGTTGAVWLAEKHAQQRAA